MSNFGRRSRSRRRSRRRRSRRRRSRRSRRRRSKRSRRRRRRKRSRRRRFGYMKNGLLSYMGNFQPALMSLAQSTTGMSAPQMSGHVGGIPKSLLSNFYTEIQ